ncbi:uncharacterized protein LOC131531394 isoform X2 [Onychostoma macrolepis]|uniref:uncharacterized protein LOC131531394 isoform X2 n=1 Tax=Onychostoma macrolepis TaxID=369639 RepID=UPI002729D5D9|nr:uncharacterized protein LOC131531394 isoform X2 [Onychostoma macrolepis]
MFFKSFKVETRKRRGAFGDDKTVKEGDSVVLKTDIQKKKDESMLWYFEDARIALINKDESTSCKYDGEGGRFKDRLEVDYETAFLTITDIRLEHSGLYEAEIIRSESSGKSQSLNRNGAKCDSTKIIKKNNLGEITETTRVNVEAKTEEEPYKTEKEKNKTKEESYTTKMTLLSWTTGLMVIRPDSSLQCFRYSSSMWSSGGRSCWCDLLSPQDLRKSHGEKQAWAFVGRSEER